MNLENVVELRHEDVLAKLAGIINKAWRDGTVGAIQKLHQCGLDLLEAKKQVGHGRWLIWVQQNLEFNERTARRLMDFSKRTLASDMTSEQATEMSRELWGHTDAYEHPAPESRVLESVVDTNSELVIGEPTYVPPSVFLSNRATWPASMVAEIKNNPSILSKLADEFGGASNVHFSSESEEWYTPPEIIERVVNMFGSVDLDPCSNVAKRVPARRHFTKDDDGLSKPWSGKIYMNPPYGRVIGDWTSHLAKEIDSGNTTEAIALVPARVDTDWFQLIAEKSQAVCFVDGRLKFSGHENSAPFPSAVVYCGSDLQGFVSYFGSLGQIWKLAR